MGGVAAPVRPPLEEVIGYRFKKEAFLSEALSHKSFAAESRTGVYNERLEFLGDSILAAVVAHRLYEDYPREDEGSLSKRKSHLVSRISLAGWAGEINLGAYLYLGIGEENSGGRARQSLLGNALEALIGAIYLDGGYAAAEKFILPFLRGRGAELEETDYKSRFQEIIQKRLKSVPVYDVVTTAGPEHDKTFEVSVRVGKKVLGAGRGKNKKEAEQNAARQALESLDKGRAAEENRHGL